MKKVYCIRGKIKGGILLIHKSCLTAHHLVLLIIHTFLGHSATYMCGSWLCLWHTLTVFSETTAAQNYHVKERRKDFKKQIEGKRKSFKQWCNPSDLRFLEMKHSRPAASPFSVLYCSY